MRLPSPRLLALVAAVTLAVSGLTACSGSDEAEPQPTPTAIADLDADSLNLVRVSYCDLMPTEAVTAALAGPSTSAETWGNGDAPPMDDAGGDLTHEFGCSWSRTGGFAARTWVFARPVTTAFADQVIASTAARNGCSTRRVATFGTPSLIQTCPLPARRTRIRHAGLFGDTWLTCEITGPRGQGAPRQRADAWCAAAANALTTDR